MRNIRVIMVLLLVVVVHISPAQMAVEQVDTAVVNMIIDEGMNRSEVMDILSTMTDVYGPRLTGSPEYKTAAEWVTRELTSWGLENARLEEWGEFGKGWSLKYFSMHLVSPRTQPLIGYPKAWSPGTKGAIKGEVAYLAVESESDFEKYKGKLKGKIVLIDEPRDIEAHFKPEARRLTDEDLLKMANAGLPDAGGRRRGFNLRRMAQMPPAERDAAMYEIARQFMPDVDSVTVMARVRTWVRRMTVGPMILKFCQDEGAVAVLDVGNGDGGTIFVGSASVPQGDSPTPGRGASAYSKDAPETLPQVSVAAEHYNSMVRAIEKGEKLMLQMRLDVEWTGVQPGINIIAEIPGTDLKNEIVMVGGHFDSWHAGTGATDNATGCSAAMEAVRIIKKLGLKPRRTIRIALWGGEEQGLIGSREYVAKHLASQEGSDMASMMGGGASGNLEKKPEYETFSVYFNHDNGTGKFRGVYMQGNEATRPIFREWLKPFNDMGASTLTLSNTGGTDHLSFDAVGLPGFQFIQDPVEYDTRTHHSNMDVYDRVQKEDMMQAATIMAVFIYNAAMRDEQFPRKPLPPPPPPRRPSAN